MEQLNQNSTEQMTTQFRLSSTFIKKCISLLQSPYFFSLLVFSSSLLFLVFHTLNLNFSPSSLISLLNFSFDRNYMFLLCNGILVILVKSSSSSSSSSLSSESPQPQESKVAELGLGSERKQVSESVEVEQSTPDEKTGFLTVGANSSEELEVPEFFEVHDQDEDDHDDNVDEEEEEEEEEEEGLAAEELNKRCEEFIRRMKQGIISESRGDPNVARFR